MDKVRDWLNNLGLGQYEDKFEEQGWDDMDTIRTMSDSDIQTCVKKPGHVRKISLAIERLNAEVKASASDSVNVTSISGVTEASPTEISKCDITTESTSDESADIQDRSNQRVTSKELVDTQWPLAVTQQPIPIDTHITDFIGETEHPMTKSCVQTDRANQAQGSLFGLTDVQDGGSKLKDRRSETDQEKDELSVVSQTDTDSETDTDNTSSDDESSNTSRKLVRLSPNNAMTSRRQPIVGQMISTSSTASVSTSTYVKDSKNVTVAEKVEIHNIQQYGETCYDKFKDQVHTVLEHYKRKRHLFVKTKAYGEVIDVLEDRNWALISGNAGDGKSTMARHLMLEYSEKGYVPVEVTSAEDWKNMIEGRGKGANKQFVMIDNMFGSLGVDERKLNAWMSLLELMVKVVKAKKGDLKVVCITRKYIFSQVSTRLSRFKEFGLLYNIDLANNVNAILPSEKEDMLRRYFEHYNVEVPEELILSVKALESTYGFPHCVEMFCTNSGLRTTPFDFFKTPIKLLEREILRLYESEKDTFCVLIILLLSENNTVCLYNLETQAEASTVTNALKLSGLQPKTVDFRTAFNKLNDVFIEEVEEGLYSFKHDSFKEVIALVSGKSHPALAIELFDIEFLSERTKVHGYKLSLHEDVVVIPKQYISKLAERLTDEMIHGSGLVACKHQAWDSTYFIQCWLRYVTEQTSANGLLVDLIQGIGHDTTIPGLLCLLSIKKREKALSVIVHAKEVQTFLHSEHGKSKLSVALIYACDNECSQDLLQTLVNKGADINYEYQTEIRDSITKMFVSHDGMMCNYMGLCTPLICSVYRGNLPNIKHLLENGASAFKQGLAGRDIGYWAVASGSIEVLRCVLEHIHMLDKFRNKCISNELQTVQFLFGENYISYCLSPRMKHVASVITTYWAFYKCSVSPIHLTDNADVLEILCKECDIINQPIEAVHVPLPEFKIKVYFNDHLKTDSSRTYSCDMPHLIFKLLNGSLNKDILDKLVEHGADINCKFEDRNILHYLHCTHSITETNLDPDILLPCLLKHGIDLNAQDSDGKTPLNKIMSPFEHACEKNDIFVQWLITSGADVNIPDKEGYKPLAYALQVCSSEILTQLIRATSFENNEHSTDGKNFFHLLAYNEEDIVQKVISLLLKKNVDINHLDNDGNAPIACAHPEVMNVFLDHGADPDMLDRCNVSQAMKVMCQKMDSYRTILEQIHVLISRGIDVNNKDNRNRNIMHYIVESSSNDIIKIGLMDMCLGNNCQIDEPDENGITPLMVAVQRCSKSVICYLVEHGASTTAVDKSGMSVLYHGFKSSVKDSEKEQIVDVIVSKGYFTRINDAIIIFALSTNTGPQIIRKLLKHAQLSDNNITQCLRNVLRSDRDDALKATLFKEVLDKYDKTYLLTTETLKADSNLCVEVLRSPLCLTILKRLGLIDHSLFCTGIDVSCLPRQDKEASVVLNLLGELDIDINGVLNVTTDEDSAEIVFAKTSKLLSLGSMLRQSSKIRVLKTDVEGNTVLHCLASSEKEDENIANVVWDICQKADCIDIQNRQGLTPLHLFCQQSELKVKCIAFLINHSKNVDAVDNHGMSAMHHLVKSIVYIDKQTEEKSNATIIYIIMDLLSNNADIDLQDNSDQTPLMYLLSNVFVNRLTPIIELFICNTMDTTKQDKTGQTLLHYVAGAYLEDDVKSRFVEELIQKNAPKDRHNVYGLSPIDHCLGMFMPKTCRALMGSVVNKTVILSHLFTDIQLFTDFHDKPDDLLDMVRYCNIDVNADSDNIGVTLLAQACRFYRETRIVKALLEYGADPNKADRLGYTCIHRLLFSSKLIYNSIHKCICFNESPETELLFQYRNSFPWECPNIISQWKELIESCNEDILGAIHSRILNDVNIALKILHILLVNKADPNIMDIDGKSPLHYCAESPVMDGFTCPAMEMLIAHGACVNLGDYEGRTPLMLCAQYERTKYRRMNILIKAGADLKAVDYNGNGVSDYIKQCIRKRLVAEQMKFTDY